MIKLRSKLSSVSFFPCNYYTSNRQDKEKLMYKSKLQELCQKQKWALPKYTFIKDGEDHCPQFKGSVVVRGITFDSPPTCKSSKQALNEAAQVAFLHFTSQPSNQRSEEFVEKTDIEKEVQKSKSSEDKALKQNVQEGFKKKLKMYVQKKNLDQPVYHIEKVGLCFRARVSIGEDWFPSRQLCETAEEAESSAAEVALLALSTDAFRHENDPRSYKVLLQELVADEGSLSPTYRTIRSNDSNCQTFFSIVEVDGEVFQGATAKSEKLAELNAAKAAYIAFIERKLFQPGNFSPQPSSDEILKLARRLGSAAISDPQENPTCGPPSNFRSSTNHETQGQNTVGKNQETANDHSECITQESIGTAIYQETDKLAGSSNADGHMQNSAETKSYLLCNKVRVFTGIPDMALPKGTIVLPISENRWTVVTLEFPNDKGM